MQSLASDQAFARQMPAAAPASPASAAALQPPDVKPDAEAAAVSRGGSSAAACAAPAESAPAEGVVSLDDVDVAEQRRILQDTAVSANHAL